MRHHSTLAPLILALLAGLSATASAQSPTTPSTSADCAAADATIYFDEDRSNLNQMALDVIDGLVMRIRNSPNCTPANVLVIGHADTYAAADESLGLSQRRASVVSDALVTRGVASRAIRMEGRGETELARDTRDGKREPANNRVVVTITFR